MMKRVREPGKPRMLIELSHKDSEGEVEEDQDSNSTEYYSLNGIIYFNIGSGGQTLQTFTSQASYIAAQNATDFG
jgi:hypothetical protein